MAEIERAPVAVLGARGGIGGAIVAELVRQGRPVRAVVRRTCATIEGAEHVGADIRDPAALRSAVAGASTIHLAAQPAYTRWPQEFPGMLDAVIGAAETSRGRPRARGQPLHVRAGRGPVDRGDPDAGDVAQGTHPSGDARGLVRGARPGRIRATAGRAADYFGPGGVGSTLGERSSQPSSPARTSNGSAAWTCPAR